MTLDQEMQAGHAAQRFADAHRNLLADECGVVDEPLAQAIERRERILAQNHMPGWVRRSLERRNDNTEQVMRVKAAHAEADKTGAELGVWLVKGVCLFAAGLMAVHLVSINWGL